MVLAMRADMRAGRAWGGRDERGTALHGNDRRLDGVHGAVAGQSVVPRGRRPDADECEQGQYDQGGAGERAHGVGLRLHRKARTSDSNLHERVNVQAVIWMVHGGRWPVKCRGPKTRGFAWRHARPSSRVTHWRHACRRGRVRSPPRIGSPGIRRCCHPCALRSLLHTEGPLIDGAKLCRLVPPRSAIGERRLRDHARRRGDRLRRASRHSACGGTLRYRQFQASLDTDRTSGALRERPHGGLRTWIHEPGPTSLDPRTWTDRTRRALRGARAAPADRSAARGGVFRAEAVPRSCDLCRRDGSWGCSPDIPIRIPKNVPFSF